jgi:glycosyltransferase involved in cell wall biosynthesis
VSILNPKFSIIIPSKNEAEDIADTLDACLRINYPDKEIIVVDDSTDETPDIVASYADRGVRLIHRAKNSNGCCGARNLGMHEAKGEIVVLLNGDGRPCPDFLDRILVHYQNGADLVLVQSLILNRDTIWGRFSHCVGLMSSTKIKKISWSEGFSCRKAAAEAVGYLPGDFPVPFCRDWMLGDAIEKAGYHKIVDLSIKMEHLWPATQKTFFRNQVHRGVQSSPTMHYFQKMSIRYLLLRESLKAGRTILRYLIIVPAVWRSIKIANRSPYGWRDIPAMFWAGLVNDIAITVGNYKGWMRLVKEEGF